MNLFMFIAHFHFMIMAEGSLRGVTRLPSYRLMSQISLRQRTTFPYIYVMHSVHVDQQYNP